MLKKGEKRQKKGEEVRRVLRNTGIPSDFFLVDGSAVSAKSPLEEIRKRFPSSQDRARARRKEQEEGRVDLLNAPERAAALMRDAHDKTRLRVGYVTDDAAYRRFVREGPRVTDGSFVEPREDRLRTIRGKFLPRVADDRLVEKLQR